MTLHASWKAQLAGEFQEPYFRELAAFVKRERAEHEVYPPPDQLFAAFNATPFDAVKVVVIGQDPYHGPGQAHGLAFSVLPGVRPPPSLKNIYTELEKDVGCRKVRHGYLMAWAERGVLLLNDVLTVRDGQPRSHADHGWERFTGKVLERLNVREVPVVFILWGSRAGARGAEFIDAHKHPMITSPHPSPYSAHNGFFGSRPFSGANDYLQAIGEAPIDWQLPLSV